ncbi:hypothetical protein [Halosegnis marinus]|uniref:YecA family protein n=1 Tax=Halosegnis marinus TaxID=3034023 RepID=A0ABD5ZR08_9EURY|nr:hypothetical protein [Halosegnis sp. DT85]
MTRVPITDDVVSQLADLLDSGELEQPTNWMGAQFLAQDFGHEELATFVFEADAATYYEALSRAAKEADADVPLP